jgi:hypothetical protein
MSSTTTVIGDRRRQALERAEALRRHPTARNRRATSPNRPIKPPPVTFYVIALVVTVFVMLGLVMVLSASSIQQFHRGSHRGGCSTGSWSGRCWARSRCGCVRASRTSSGGGSSSPGWQCQSG